MSTFLPILAMLALFGPGSSVSSPTASTTGDELAALVAEYDAAQAAFDERIRESDLSGRRELRQNPPAAVFWPRFETLAEGGEGRALVWMATHLRDKGLRFARELEPEKRRLYGLLVERHAAEGWFAEALTALERDHRWFDEPLLVRTYSAVVDRSEEPAIRAQAMFQLGMALIESDEPEQHAAGEGWLRRASEELSDTEHGRRARAELERPRVGQPVPDFEGETIDGESINLADHRGKVVVLNFYGFW